MDRRTASTEVHELLQLLAEPYRGPIGQKHNLSDPGSAIEQRVRHLGNAIRGITARSRVRRIRSVTWTLAHAGLTVVAAGVLVFGGPLSVVLALVTFRVAGSLLQPVPGTAADLESTADADELEASDTWQVAWKACVVTHLDDALALLAVASYLFVHQRTMWGVAVLLAVLVQLAGTLFRVAAVHDGIVLRRLVLERVCRNGFLLLGIGAAALWQPAAPPQTLPIIALAALGGLLYGALEIARVGTTASAARRIDEISTLDEMVWRRTSNLLPVVERSARADIVDIRRAREGFDGSEATLAG